RGRARGDEVPQLLFVGLDPLIEVADLAGPISGIPPRGGEGDVLATLTPRGDRLELGPGQRSACIDAEVLSPQQRDQRVRRRGPLPGHVVPFGQEDLKRSADSFEGAGVAEM